MRRALGTASRQERSPGKTGQCFTDTKPRALRGEAGTLTSAKGTGLIGKTPSKVNQESKKRRQTDRRPSRPRRRHRGTRQTQERDLTPARPESRRGGTWRERSPPALAATTPAPWPRSAGQQRGSRKRQHTQARRTRRGRCVAATGIPLKTPKPAAAGQGRKAVRLSQWMQDRHVLPTKTLSGNRKSEEASSTR